ncbi:MAG TPA: SDR family oxidoreductase [Chthoniobacteraceae bacterium]|nr:SDR family oxidoreductase [Chthoniobacteraceae bacterium]
MGRALIAGCGFMGAELARQLQATGWDVAGVTHTAESAASISKPGLPVVACDISDAADVKTKLASLEGIDALVDCVSSGHGGAEAYRANYLRGARNLLDFVRPKTFLFTSSTSVYAQTDGSWVTEENSAKPPAETGRILRETEELILTHGGIVARLAGIYGPGRWALVRKFLDGSAVIEDGGGRWVNQIHRDDAASAIAFLLNNRAAPGIYNVSDDTPLPQRECYEILAAHFQKPLPPAGSADPNRKRGVTNKRVSNAKLRALGWQPRFGSMRDALVDSAPQDPY